MLDLFAIGMLYYVDDFRTSVSQKRVIVDHLIAVS
jgi:hypothetical protein